MATCSNDSGYVVVGYDGRRLDINMHWMEEGPDMAAIHSAHEIGLGGDWMIDAKEVWSARRNAQTQYTEIFGEPIPFCDFLPIAAGIKN